MNTIEWLRSLIACNTVSYRSNLELIDKAAGYFSAQGLAPWLTRNEDGSKANLFVTIPAAGGSTEGGLILSGHTDVVPAEPENWATNPFCAEIRENKLFGRGAADMKGFIASVLAAVPAMKAARLEKPLHIALSYDEEVGCLGAPLMIEEIKRRGLSPEYCIVGEPTSMQAVSAHKGIHVFRCRLHGKAAHSSLPEEGLNTIEYAARLISFIQGLSESFKQPPYTDPGFNVPYSSISINTVRGGSAANIIPPVCEFLFDYRNLPHMGMPDLIGPLHEHIRRELEPQMRKQYPQAAIEIEEQAGVPAMPQASQSRLPALMAGLGIRPAEKNVSYTTEGGLFQQAGIPTVICGPGSIEQAHKPNEFIELGQLALCDAFLQKLIKAFSE